ncbi:MAG: T9SS type A sorting domain-containing protein [Bacteroidia bacterium]|nr:T9SS type A sorting domain-containing protein [Bacteroidia bacterium]
MKKLLLSFCLIILVQTTWSQVPSTPTIIPAQPTSNDVIKVVTKVNTPNQAIVVDPCVATISGGTIRIKSCYCQGMLPATQTFIDTLTIGQLSPGNYNILHTAFSSTAQQHCTKGDSSDALIQITIPQTTQIYEAHIENNLQVYPNPTSDNLSITNQGEAVVYIYSVSGALVKRTRISGNGQLDISELPNGLYVLKLDSGEKTKITRIVKHSKD